METIQPLAAVKVDTGNTPSFSLVVIRPFHFPAGQRDYKAGDEIKDAATVASVLASELAGNCNKVAA